jgi:hypothetical protein
MMTPTGRFSIAALVMLGFLLGGQRRSAPAPPEPPRVVLELPSFSSAVTGISRAVPAGVDLQAALQAAAPGDEIVLEAGAVWRGNFTLPRKQGSGWVTIRSSALDELPAEGVRVSPEDAAAMPKIVSPNAGAALTAAPGARGYRLVGIEITQDPNVPQNYGLVVLGDGAETSLDQTPRDFVLDRVYIHGSPRAALKRGVALNSAFTIVANSWISDCHVVGQDAQAIGGWSGPGPYKIVNNRLEGSGENLMFGGADPRIPNLVPCDIEIRGNYFFKPLAWRQGEPSFAGKRWTVKNLFELKNARRVLIEGNVFENSWAHGQTGFAILLTVRNQGGKAPWCAVEDIAFLNNIVRHCGSGISILGEDNNHRSQQARRITIRNNLFDDINAARWGGDGRMFQILSPRRPTVDLAIEHNTALHVGRGNTFISMGDKGKTAQNFVFRDNIVTRGEYGIFGSGKGEGRTGLEWYCDGWTFERNVIIGKARGTAVYPPGNLFLTTPQDAGFRDFAQGDYRLDGKSRARGFASDGADPGADLDLVKKATAGAISGVWP